jgi:Fe2+ or Zn2+ uptake regulation protein
LGLVATRTTAEETFAEQLARNGLRATRQRVAVLRLLDAERGHPSATDVYARLAEKHPNLSQKTVYEILDALVEAGLARRVTQLTGPARYEARLERHDHAWCRVCGRIFDVPAHVDRRIREQAELPEGFRVEAVQITLEGCCARCAKSA